MLSEEAKLILNDPERIKRRDEWFSRLSDLFDGRNNEYSDRYVFTLTGASAYAGMPSDRECVNWALDKLAKMPEFTGNRFCPLCIEYNPMGVHFIDYLFGANVYTNGHQWYNDTLDTPVGSLEFPDYESNPMWIDARTIAEQFLDAGVSLPVFAAPILSSPLNIIVNLYGEEALVAMMEDEDAVRHDLEVINTLIRALHKWYRDNIPQRQLQCTVVTQRAQPPGYGQLCGCTSHLLSGGMYREYIMELDDALLGDYQSGGMIHLCGAHTQHIEAFRSMPHLKAVQINDRAAADLEEYYNGLREDQIIYLNPCDKMPLEEALAITGGDRLVICSPIEAPEKPA